MIPLISSFYRLTIDSRRTGSEKARNAKCIPLGGAGSEGWVVGGSSRGPAILVGLDADQVGGIELVAGSLLGARWVLAGCSLGAG